ncbi:GntR family transcriptional regulator [Actinocorallia lasiicapitis]
MRLERPRALYRQVADDLRRDIADGRYIAGALLPSQPELAREYGLTQASIGKAITLLEHEGLIRTERGKGSFVLDVPTVKRVRRIPLQGESSGSSFAEEMRHSGREPRTVLASVTILEPPADVAADLRLASPEQVLVRRRHMFADERPVQLATSYIPLAYAGDEGFAYPDTGPRGIQQRLAERGHHTARFQENIEARTPQQDEADFLGITLVTHVIEVRRFTLTADDRPLEVVVNVFPARLWQLSYTWAAGS